MSSTGISALEKANQDVNIWLNAIDDKMSWSDKNHAYRLLRSVLHALRDMLGVDEAADLAAQMPVLIRGIYYEGWNPSSTPADDRTLKDFVRRVQRDFRADPLEEPEQGISAVFSVLNAHISAGEVEHVRSALREDIRELWKPDGAALH